jgi:YggT family protein
LIFGGSSSGASPIAQIINGLSTLLVIAIIARSLLSWFNMDPRSPLIQALNAVTEPILDPIRRIMPRLGMIDFSPLVAILLLQFISRGLIQVLG